ncbi:zinc transporter 6-like, partial [Littorina saxatilis]|uniref:zinc transporter 6-like n=1 Tax=Littorina saxatilis TaxID=31220 RepID=UPI0038B64A8B
TTPSHILSQLDKLLREASTLDGVLEFRHEHFWTLSFGTLAGSVQVRVRRDADEQLVLAHVFHRLSNLVRVLTIQIFKDDWTRGSAYAVLGSSPFGPMSGGTGGRAQSPTHEYSASHLPVSSFRPLPGVSSPSVMTSGFSPPPRPTMMMNPAAGVGRIGGVGGFGAGGGGVGGSTVARSNVPSSTASTTAPQFSPVNLL